MRGSCDLGGVSDDSRLAIYQTLSIECLFVLRPCVYAIAMHPRLFYGFPACLCILLISISCISFCLLLTFLFVCWGEGIVGSGYRYTTQPINQFCLVVNG